MLVGGLMENWTPLHLPRLSHKVSHKVKGSLSERPPLNSNYFDVVEIKVPVRLYSSCRQEIGSFFPKLIYLKIIQIVRGSDKSTTNIQVGSILYSGFSLQASYSLSFPINKDFFFSSDCSELSSPQLLAVRKKIHWKCKDHSLASTVEGMMGNKTVVKQVQVLIRVFLRGAFPRGPLCHQFLKTQRDYSRSNLFPLFHSVSWLQNMLKAAVTR